MRDTEESGHTEEELAQEASSATEAQGSCIVANGRRELER